ncbi:DUF922 domain-containing Zn-dependent protease [Agrobacterium vitis]|uniref:DUF922 domain-containing Zn-dependent protease n=1 Tax=Agrobacterium vitis TaxID=373 RepID=UPI001F21977E|nr:DUF922 domain-containing protein [Agrobacterium vitis]
MLDRFFGSNNLLGVFRSEKMAIGVMAWLFLNVANPTFADWQAVEQIATYPVSGQSGPQLYQSIGEKGPVIGTDKRIHVIAHTTFKLTWTRKYVPHGSTCVLETAIPKLTVIYTLPRPSQSLTSPVRENWAKFIAGIETHERVHGQNIKDMVKAIEAASIGLTVPDDPDCKKIRTDLTKRLGEISDRKRERDRVFEQSEMAPGGPIQQLILSLVNGG